MEPEINPNADPAATTTTEEKKDAPKRRTTEEKRAALEYHWKTEDNVKDRKREFVTAETALEEALKRAKKGELVFNEDGTPKPEDDLDKLAATLANTGRRLNLAVFEEREAKKLV